MNPAKRMNFLATDLGIHTLENQFVLRIKIIMPAYFVIAGKMQFYVHICEHVLDNDCIRDCQRQEIC